MLKLVQHTQAIYTEKDSETKTSVQKLVTIWTNDMVWRWQEDDKGWLVGAEFNAHLTQYRSFRTRSSQPIT